MCQNYRNDELIILRYPSSPCVTFQLLCLAPIQPEPIWKAIQTSQMKSFIHEALWCKLRAGQCQKEWKPLEMYCPLDGKLETLACRLH